MKYSGFICGNYNAIVYNYIRICCFSEGDYQLWMYDDFGDGWNGNTLEIDGIITATLEDGREGMIEFNVAESMGYNLF